MSNSHRELKRSCRMDLHEAFSEPVWFFKEEGDVPALISVRLHFQFDRVGNLLRQQYAEREDIDPKVIFLSPVNPVRNAYIVTEDMGLWFVDSVQPPDDITVTANVKRANDRDMERLQLDKDAPWCGLAPPPLEAL